MMLAHQEIKEAREQGLLDIEPWHENLLGATSYDVTLGDIAGLPYVYDASLGNMRYISRTPAWLLYPNAFVLGSTAQRVTLSDQITAQLVGKSTRAREGIQIESAGFVDAGFVGQLTLEIKELAGKAQLLHPDMKIGQLVFFKHTSTMKPYGTYGRYMDQHGPTSPRAERE